MERQGLRLTLGPDDWRAAADQLAGGDPADPDVAKEVADFLRKLAADGLTASSEPSPEDPEDDGPPT